MPVGAVGERIRANNTCGPRTGSASGGSMLGYSGAPEVAPAACMDRPPHLRPKVDRSAHGVETIPANCLASWGLHTTCGIDRGSAHHIQEHPASGTLSWSLTRSPTEFSAPHNREHFSHFGGCNYHSKAGNEPATSNDPSFGYKAWRPSGFAPFTHSFTIAIGRWRKRDSRGPCPCVN